MLTTLKKALGSSKSATTIAGMSLVVATVGVAGAATLPSEAADEAEAEVADLQVPPEEEEEEANDLDTDSDTDVASEGDGPDDNASDTAKNVWNFISDWEGEKDCTFGLGVAAIASGNEDLADKPCGEEASDEEELGEESTSENADEGLSEANEAAPVEVPADESQGEDAGNPGYDANSNPGSGARDNAGPPSNG